MNSGLMGDGSSPAGGNLINNSTQIWGALQGSLPLPPLPSDALRLHSDPSAQLDLERSANQRCAALTLLTCICQKLQCTEFQDFCSIECWKIQIFYYTNYSW